MKQEKSFKQPKEPRNASFLTIFVCHLNGRMPISWAPHSLLFAPKCSLTSCCSCPQNDVDLGTLKLPKENRISLRIGNGEGSTEIRKTVYMEEYTTFTINHVEDGKLETVKGNQKSLKIWKRI